MGEFTTVGTYAIIGSMGGVMLGFIVSGMLLSFIENRTAHNKEH